GLLQGSVLMARRRRRQRDSLNPYLRQAAEYATIKYGPEVQGLRTLVAQAQKERRQRVTQARGARDAILGAIDESRPRLAGEFDRAAQQMQSTREIIDQDLARIGPVGGGSAAI